MPHEEEENDELDHRIMALDKTSRNTIGCAYYVAREGTLLCMEEMEDAEDQVMIGLKLDVEPTIVLVSPRIEMPEQEIARSNSLDLSGM